MKDSNQIRDTMSSFGTVTPVTAEEQRIGRPRSEEVRTAVLNAVDDLVVEIGYAAITMKNIAERAGVSRQTVYRWWSTKAEILFEASAADAEEEMSIPPSGSPLAEVTAYLHALVGFLVESPAGAGYRALVGEAQHDAAVARLLASRDVLGDSAKVVIARALGPDASGASAEQVSAQLVGPVFFSVLSGRSVEALDVELLARQFLSAVAAP
jgi:AcrR family transcriptional regulator